MPFVQLAQELFPGQFKPTPTHHFIKLMQDRGILSRVYTQNIDDLERLYVTLHQFVAFLRIFDST
jgi:NAD-dependent deacetylase sirtuin 2